MFSNKEIIVGTTPTCVSEATLGIEILKLFYGAYK